MDWLSAVHADGTMTSLDASPTTLTRTRSRHQNIAQNTADGEGDAGNTNSTSDGDSDHQAPQTRQATAHDIKTPPEPGTRLMAEG